MKIKRVKLINYRNHKDREFEFTDGINLLLGKNGSGKSSVLEALGLALFDAEGRTSGKDAVSFGEDTAIILVEFVANDEISYTIEKSIGKTNNIKFSKSGEPSSRITDKRLISEKMKELSGISNNVENIYRNVITSYQNKMTSVFLDTPKERENTFDKIFDTEIYRRMYEGFTKNYSYDLQSKSENFMGIRDSLQSRHVDKNLIIAEIAQLEVELKRIEGEVSALVGQIESKSREEAGLIKTRNEIESAGNKSLSLGELKKKEESALAESRIALARSEEAAKIISLNLADFNSYNELYTEIRQIEEEIRKLESTEKQMLDAEKQFSDIRQKLELNKQEVLNLSDNQSKLMLQLDEKRARLVESESTLSADKSKLILSLEELNKIITQKDKLDIAIKNYDALKDKEKELQLLLNEKSKSIIDEKSIQESLLKEKEILANIRAKIDEKRKIEAGISELKARIKDNKEAGEVLKGGICPFLSEDCKNISSGTEPESFFNNKEQKLNQLLEKENLLLKDYEGIESVRATTENGIALLGKKLTDNDNLLIEIKRVTSDFEIIRANVQVNEKNISEIISGFGPEQAEQSDEINAKAIQASLSSKLTEIKTSSDIVRSLIAQKEIEIKQMKSVIDEDDQLLGETLNRIALCNLLNEKLISDEKLINTELTELRDTLKPYSGKKLRRDEKKIIIEKLKPAYDLYVSNQQSASECVLWEKKIEDHLANCSKYDVEISDIQQVLTELRKNFSEEMLSAVQINLIALRGQHSDILPILGETKSKLEQKNEDLKVSRKTEEEINDFNIKIDRNNRKRQLAESFRTSINGMGKLVASRLLNKVEIMATENYRRISGRTESIRWINEEKQSYEVQLAGNSLVRKFDQLSGGEQVTVALALRAAMANLLTYAKFAIFDEPTNNLDVERKAALSESLNEMLHNLSQTIIVTHDETFREMAQNTISLI